MSRSPHKIEQYRIANLQAAEVILRDIDRYGGEESLMVRWARTILPAAKRIEMGSSDL